MPDIQLNAKSITTTSATTAPAAGTSEGWTVTALATGIRTLAAGESYALVDATTGATVAQQAEIIRVTAATAGGTSITVTRGCEGTTPVAHANPSTFNLVLVAGSVRKMPHPDYYAPDPTATYALKNEYDVLRGIYNYKSSNTRILEQGLSRAMVPTGGTTTHLIIGDSVSAGCISNVAPVQFDRLRSWPMAMRDQLRVIGVPANGTGIIRHVDPAALDTRWGSVTGTWTGVSGAYTVASTTSASAILTPDRSGNIFDYWYFDSGLATFTIAVDGASSGAGFTTVTANGSAGWKSVRLYGVPIIANVSQIKITVTALNGGSHYAFGGSVSQANGGLLVENAAQSGSTAYGTGLASWSDYTAGTGMGTIFKNGGGRQRVVTDAASTSGSPNLTSATGAFTDLDLGKPIDEINLTSGGRMFPDNCFIGARNSGTSVVVYQGVGSTAVPVNAYATLSSQQVRIGRDPSCIHIALGGNDLTAGNTDAQIQTAITSIRSQFPNSDCILHMTHEFATSFVTSARELTYQKAMVKLADDLDVPLYDWRDRVGTFALGQPNGSYGDYAVHLTSATYADLGAQLATVFGGGSGRQQSGVPILDDDVVNKGYIDRRKGKAAGATALTTVETVIARVPIPANSLSVGDSFRVALWMKPAATTVTTTRVRVGTTGTTSDASVIVMCATAATSANARYVEGQVSVNAIGASATIIGGGTETVAANTVSIGTAAAATSSFNSTVINYATVTVQNTSSTTTTVYSGSLEWM